MPSFRVDADGDVEMAAPPPVFEVIKPPELKSWDQESLVEWLRKRRRYREEIVERCRISQEPVDAVLHSVRASLPPKLLNYLAHYVFRQPRDAITDQEILDKIQERVSEKHPAEVPDIKGESLSMVYPKAGCELEKMERKLPSKGDRGKRTSRPDASRFSNRPQGTPSAPTAGPKPGNSSGAASRPPPRDGCYFCKEPHVVRLCPTATEEQKMLCYQRMKDTKVAKVKAVRASRLPVNRQVVINGLVELLYRPDSGSDVNVIPASALRDLEACAAPVAVTNMLMPVYLERVGGDLLGCRTSCDVDVMMGTAAGPVNVVNVRCIIVDDDEEEFLLGNPTLVALGIDEGRQMEQLAMSSSGVYSEENDGLPDDPETGQDDEAEVQELLDQLVANAGP
ncbi:hypothetical protein PF006_g26266 [Phytophthora fragariae]|uniref:Uncharacterized protein n=1 Tax=Phytophthora fragariae TaxID=53985 RepID=A0A6A3QYY7_9STRA|nr:hypothetical protein PF006_g26266 [Phytophthora fragariae]